MFRGFSANGELVFIYSSDLQTLTFGATHSNTKTAGCFKSSEEYGE